MVIDGLRCTNGDPAVPPFGGASLMEFNGTSIIFQEPAIESYKRTVLEENFKHLPAEQASVAVTTNLNFEVVGTGATTDDVTFSTTEGGILLTTDSTAAQEVIIAPHLGTTQTAWAGFLWGTENQVIWDAVIRTGASVAAVVIWAGLKLTNTSTVATDDDQVFFRFDTVVANWEAVDSIADSDTETDTGIAVAASTNYHLKISVDSDRKASFYINNLLVHKTAALTNDIDLIPYVGVQGDAKTLTLVKEKISRIIFE